MKNINDLKEGLVVIFNFKEREFQIEKVVQEIITISINGFFEREVKMKNIYPANEHTRTVSKLVRETRHRLMEYIPSSAKINKKITEKMFLDFWIDMCEAEGDEKEFQNAKKKFDLFITILHNAIETLEQLKVLGIPLLEPMIPDLDEEK